MAKKEFKNKKDKVMAKKSNNTMLFAGVGVVVVAVVVAIVLFTGNSKPKAPVGGETTNVGQQDYSAKNIPMTELKADLANGKLSVNLDDIKKNQIVRFEDSNFTIPLKSGENVPMPLVAYVSNKGDIKVAIADCEPCSSTRFHIEGTDLVCDSCGTRWTLNDLQAVSGGCTQYPPDQKPYKIEGTKLTINEADIKDWKPRV